MQRTNVPLVTRRLPCFRPSGLVRRVRPSGGGGGGVARNSGGDRDRSIWLQNMRRLLAAALLLALPSSLLGQRKLTSKLTSKPRERVEEVKLRTGTRPLCSGISGAPFVFTGRKRAGSRRPRRATSPPGSSSPAAAWAPSASAVRIEPCLAAVKQPPPQLQRPLPS